MKSATKNHQPPLGAAVRHARIQIIPRDCCIVYAGAGRPASIRPFHLHTRVHPKAHRLLREAAPAFA